jgi:hypothetical protein
MFKSNATKVWEQDGAIVRDVNKLTHKTDGVKFVNGLECNITHVPARVGIRYRAKQVHDGLGQTLH